ncbi:regucalcin-like [Amphiura filiformis]|uniref:regucalcin-like n=1 Tax=Amphiura filiformis TaxID=82378 RepID=UPI003B211924
MSVEVLKSTSRGSGALLEGPHWDPVTQTLLYVEIYSGKVHRYTPATDSVETVDVGEFVGAVVPTKSGKTIIAGRRHYAFLDWKTGALNRIAEIDADKPDNRFNDGKCDPMGRFWAGTMGPEDKPAQVRPKQGSLFCLHSDRTVTKHVENIDIANGMAWSPDRKTMYYIDSLAFGVDAFDYNKTTGALSNRRQVIAIPHEEEGFPDGMTIDEEGMLWVACFSKSRVNRYNPVTGDKLQMLTFPATNITSCCFGGPNYDILFVTSSSFQLTSDQPLAGSIFAVKDLGVKGLPSNTYHD